MSDPKVYVSEQHRRVLEAAGYHDGQDFITYPTFTSHKERTMPESRYPAVRLPEGNRATRRQGIMGQRVSAVIRAPRALHPLSKAVLDTKTQHDLLAKKLDLDEVFKARKKKGLFSAQERESYLALCEGLRRSVESMTNVRPRPAYQGFQTMASTRRGGEIARSHNNAVASGLVHEVAR